jgi:hypothetical protein
VGAWILGSSVIGLGAAFVTGLGTLYGVRALRNAKAASSQPKVETALPPPAELDSNGALRPFGERPVAAPLFSTTDMVVAQSESGVLTAPASTMYSGADNANQRAS